MLVQQSSLSIPYPHFFSLWWLSFLYFRAHVVGFCEGFRPSRGECVVLALQCVDDALVFYGASLVQVKGIGFVLGCFELMMGYKVNFRKSSVVGVGAVETFVSKAVDLLGCRVESFVIRFLGFSLSRSWIRTSNWNLIIERFDQRLSMWKGRLLFFKSCLTLILLTCWSFRTSQFTYFHFRMLVSVVGEDQTYFFVGRRPSFFWWGFSSCCLA